MINKVYKGYFNCLRLELYLMLINMGKKKFVFISPNYPSVFLLMEKEDYTANPCRFMKELGYDAEILTLWRKGLKEEETVRGIRIKRFKSTFSLLNYINSSDDVILVHSLLRPFLPTLLSSLLNKPKIMTPNTYHLGSNKLVSFISLILMKRFDFLFNLTPYEREYFKKSGIDGEKLKFLPMPIDYKFFSQKVSNKESIRKKWGVDEGDFVIVTFCNIKAVKNVDIMLRAVFLLKNKIKNIKFILVGPNSLDNVRYRDKYQKEHHFVLRDEVNKLSLKENVIVTGVLDFEDIIGILNISDVYVNSSSIETQCLSAYESSAAGLPLCLPRLGTFTMVFKDRALYHNPRDPNKLAENLLFYYKNPKQRKSMGSVLKVFVKDWDHDIIKKKMICYYKSVLKKYGYI